MAVSLTVASTVMEAVYSPRASSVTFVTVTFNLPAKQTVMILIPAIVIDSSAPSHTMEWGGVTMEH